MGTAERDGMLALAERHIRADSTLGVDKGYDVLRFVAELERRGVRAHIARHTTNGRRSPIYGRTARGKN